MKLYELVKTIGYGVTAEDPETEIIEVVVEDELPKLKAKLATMLDECGYDSEPDVDDMGGRWVDPDCDTVTVLAILDVEVNI